MKDTMERLCAIIDEHLDVAVDELERSGKLSMEDAKYIDLLTHTKKSAKAVMEDSYHAYERRRRDSMGRFREGYRGGRDEFTERLREVMADAPDEQSRKSIERMIRSM